MYEKQRIWVESEPFRWLGRAVFVVVAIVLLALWWYSITPARAETPEKIPTFAFTFACNATHCVVPKEHLEILFAANKDLAEKLAAKRGAECPPAAPTVQPPNPRRGGRT